MFNVNMEDKKRQYGKAVFCKHILCVNLPLIVSLSLSLSLSLSVSLSLAPRLRAVKRLAQSDAMVLIGRRPPPSPGGH